MKKIEFIKNHKKYFLFLNLFYIGLLIVVIVVFSKQEDGKAGSAFRDHDAKYTFTNPILDYEEIEMSDSAISYKDLDEKVADLIQTYSLTNAAVYYRDLNNGQWIGVNEKEPFVLASLAKLPIFIALFKKAEDDPEFLDSKFTITEKDREGAATQDIKPEDSIIVGNTYSMFEIGKKMIKESDNVAATFLLNKIDRKFIDGIFKSVGVPYTETKQDVFIRVKDYAGFFRVLFNASYLSRENSERALAILTETKFDMGLVAGVPKGTIVAHKFGEREYMSPTGPVETQLHDCGIVYFSENPYLLCVMTRGKSYENQGYFIRDISKYIYEKVANG